MNPTIALYDRDAYQDRFDALVLSCREEGGRFRVILDQTCFFPEQGGQTADTGWLGENVRVLDAQIASGVITHWTDGPLTPGERVEGRIDFSHRFSHMQQHTGEHIFSGLAHSRFGATNVGFHLSDRTVTMDYDIPLSETQVRQLEDEANSVIWRNLEVLVSWPAAQELPGLSYRSKKEIDGPLRLVTIPGVDVCACCAPHVRRTGEVGLLRVIGLMRYKGGVRLQILCGRRALAYSREDSAVLSRMERLLSCQREELPAQTEKLLEREKQLRQRLNAGQAAALLRQADRAPADARNVLLEAGDIDEKSAAAAADRLAGTHEGVCGVLFGEPQSRLILVSRRVPLRALAQALREQTGFRGGGDDGCVRGQTKQNAEELTHWLDAYRP